MTAAPLIPAEAGILVFCLGPRLRGDERTPTLNFAETWVTRPFPRCAALVRTPRMNETVKKPARDYSKTLFLPKTDFPMRAGLPQKEPDILARWQRLGLYRRLREAAQGARPLHPA